MYLILLLYHFKPIDFNEYTEETAKTGVWNQQIDQIIKKKIMTNLNIKSAMISAAIVWTLGVTAFVASYFVRVMSDPDIQANWVLSIALIPSAALGAHIYYKKGYKTNGFVLGSSMFLVALILDALITVPIFIMPQGGNHITFFTDPGFWFIAIEYVSVVAGYWQIKKAVNSKKLTRS